ncbi:MAG: hypothetical protein ACRBDI_06350 [Alphaproteobacteria bacterium]
MNISEDNPEDFGIEDDFDSDESWDEDDGFLAAEDLQSDDDLNIGFDGDGDNNAGRKASKPRGLKPIIFIMLSVVSLGAAAVFVYPDFFQDEKKIPIIQIEKSDVSSEIISIDNEQEEANAPLSENAVNPLPPSLPTISNSGKSKDSIALNHNEDNYLTDGILTPLPEDISEKEITLAPLDNEVSLHVSSDVKATPPLPNASPSIDEPIQIDNSDINSEANQDNISPDTIFDENTLLSKTDESPSLIIDNPIEVIDEKPSPESNLAPQPSDETPHSSKNNNELLESEKSADETADTAAPHKVDKIKPVTETNIPPQLSPVWKIKAAQPNKAVVRDQASGEVRSIETGYRLRGIGRIKAIEKINGKWIIRGENGTIRQ